jgi:ferrochelatase
MNGRYDALLLVAFGGPEQPADVEPFLERVTAGRSIPPDRLSEVADRYLSVGGRSPLNARMRTLLSTVRAELADRCIDLPVFWGNRNAAPLLADAVAEMAAAGVERALAWTASPFASYSTCRQYREDLAAACSTVGAGAPAIDMIRRHHDHPGLLEPAADRLGEALERLPADRRDRAHLLFSAHSIPTALADTCDYVAQVREAARLVAAMVDPDGHHPHEVVWQSRSGSPGVPWLEPDVADRIERLAADGAEAVAVSPIGFPVENFEIVWDLDTDASRRAEAVGVAFTRAGAVDRDPRFTAMVVDLVVERLGGHPDGPGNAAGTLGVGPDTCAGDCCPDLR